MFEAAPVLTHRDPLIHRFPQPVTAQSAQMLSGRYKFYFARGDDVGQRGGKLAADKATGLLLLRKERGPRR